MKVNRDLILRAFAYATTGGATMLLNYLFDGEVAKTLGIGEKIGVEAAKLFVMLAPNYMVKFGEQYATIRDFDKNHDLENALVEAYSKTIARIEEDFVQVEEINSTLYQQLIQRLGGTGDDSTMIREIIHDHFFDKMLIFLSTDTEKQAFISGNSQLTLESYLTSAFEKAIAENQLLAQYTEGVDREMLIRFFKEKFLHYFPQAFTQELKNDAKAKTAYFKNLLELSLARLAEIRQDTTHIRQQNEKLADDVAKLVNKDDLAGMENTLTGLSESSAASLETLSELNAASAELLQGHELVKSAIATLNALAVRTNNDLAAIAEAASVLPALRDSLTGIAKDINDIKSDVGKLRELMEVQNCWVPNLVLDEPELNEDRSNIFEFKTQYVTFTGRSLELAHLYDFIDDEKPFSWLMLKGAGGAGKSRLAQELCIKAADQGFMAGFSRLEHARPPDDDRKIGKLLPLLIVIDYATSDVAKASAFIRYFQEKLGTAKKYGQPTNKVRILVVDRDFKNIWDEHTLDLRSSYFGEYRPMELLNQQNDIRWAIIRMVVEKELGSPTAAGLLNLEANKRGILSKLNKADPLKRPLFAFFAAEALIYDPQHDLTNWTIQNLLELHIKRLQRIRDKYEGYRTHRAYLDELLFINTFCRELSNGELNNLLRNRFGLNPQERQSVRKAYQQLVEQKEYSGEITYLGLQPDYLAGFYLIYSYIEASKQDKDDAAALIGAAWENNPSGFYWTYTLLLEDFRHTDFLGSDFEVVTINSVIGCCNANNAHQAALLFLTSQIFYGKVANADEKYTRDAEAFFDSIADLAAQYPNNADVQYTWARAFLNMFDLKAARPPIYYYELFKKEFSGSTDNRIEELQLYCIYNFAISQESPVKIEEAKKELEKLKLARPQMVAVEGRLLEVIRKLSNAGISQEKIEILYGESCTIFEQSNHKQELSGTFATSLFSFMLLDGTAEKGPVLFKKIVDLYRIYPKSVIAELLSRIYFTQMELRVGTVEVDIPGQLEILYRHFPNNRLVTYNYLSVLLLQAKGLQDFKMLSPILRRACKLFEHSSQQPDLLQVFIQLLSYLCSLPLEPDQLEQPLDQFRKLLFATNFEAGIYQAYLHAVDNFFKNDLPITSIEREIGVLMPGQIGRPFDFRLGDIITKALRQIAGKGNPEPTLSVLENFLNVIQTRLTHVLTAEEIAVFVAFTGSLTLQFSTREGIAESKLNELRELTIQYPENIILNNCYAASLYLEESRHPETGFASRLKACCQGPMSKIYTDYYLNYRMRQCEQTPDLLNIEDLVEEFEGFTRMHPGEKFIQHAIASCLEPLTFHYINDAEKKKITAMAFKRCFPDGTDDPATARLWGISLNLLVEHSEEESLIRRAAEELAWLYETHKTQDMGVLLCGVQVLLIYQIHEVNGRLVIADEMLAMVDAWNSPPEFTEAILLMMIQCLPLTKDDRRPSYLKTANHYLSNKISLDDVVRIMQVTNIPLLKVTSHYYVSLQLQLCRFICNPYKASDRIVLSYGQLLSYSIVLGTYDENLPILEELEGLCEPHLSSNSAILSMLASTYRAVVAIACMEKKRTDAELQREKLFMLINGASSSDFLQECLMTSDQMIEALNEKP